MDMSREKDQKGKKTPSMERSPDNDPERCVYK